MRDPILYKYRDALDPKHTPKHLVDLHTLEGPVQAQQNRSKKAQKHICDALDALKSTGETRIKEIEAYWHKNKHWIKDGPIHLSTVMGHIIHAAYDCQNDTEINRHLTYIQKSSEVKDLVEFLIEITPEMEPRELCFTAYALSRLQVGTTEQYEKLKESLDSYILEYSTSKFNSHDISQLVWGFTRQNLLTEELCFRLAEKSHNWSRGMSFRHFITIAQIVAEDPKAAPLSSTLFEWYNEQNFLVEPERSVECVYLLSKIDRTKLTDDAWRMAQTSINLLDSDQLVATILSLNQKNCRFRSVYNAIANKAKSLRQEGNLSFEQLAQIVSGLTTMNLVPTGFLDYSIKEFLRREKISIDTMASFACSLSKYKKRCDLLVYTLMSEFDENAENFSDQGRADFLWALAVIGKDSEIKKAWENFRKQPVLNIDNVLYPVTLYEVSRACNQSLPNYLIEPLQNIVNIASKSITNSRLEQEIEQALCELNIKYKREHRVSSYSADFLIGDPEDKLILEVDGDQYHYISGDPANGLLGGDIIRERSIEKDQYTIKRIPYSLWTGWKCKNQHLEKLRELLGFADTVNENNTSPYDDQLNQSPLAN